jgi:hypothetical protein
MGVREFCSSEHLPLQKQLEDIGSPYCKLHGCHQKASSRLRLCTSSQKPVLENMRHLHMRHLHMRLVSEFGIPKIPHSDGYKVGQWVHESPILRHPNTLLRSLTGGFSRSALQRRVRGIGRGGRKF